MFTAGSSMAIDYAPKLQKYLQDTYKVELEQTEPYTLRTPSNIIIYVKWSKTMPLWYGLDKAVYDRLLHFLDSLWQLLWQPQRRHSLFRKARLSTYLMEYLLNRDLDRGERWQFSIDSSHQLKLNNVDKPQEIEEVYLNHWDQINDLKGKLSDSFAVYLTGYA
jgi:hypothetical protein